VSKGVKSYSQQQTIYNNIRPEVFGAANNITKYNIRAGLDNQAIRI
jgi:hypothetical protein